MKAYIKDVFDKEFNIDITPLKIRQFKLYVYQFETRKQHPLALNSPLLGVVKMFFLNDDQKNLFDLFNIDSRYLTKVVNSIPTINSSFKITGNPYNVLITYLLHKTQVSTTLSQADKNDFMFLLIKMLHYKFFTSLVNHNFPHGSNEAIMQATINSLTEKFDITKYGTWKKTIEARCEDFLNTNSIHLSTIAKFDDDQKILYVLSDTQTRLRNKLKIIVSMYHEIKQQGDTIGSYALTTEIDGEKLLVSNVSMLDTMIANLSNELLTPHKFINNEHVKIVCTLFSNLRPDMFRYTLSAFSARATNQIRNGQLDKIITNKDDTHYYIGSRVLLRTIIQKTYRHCIINKVDMKSKIAILEKTRNLYASSRVNDADILDIKNSVLQVIDECANTNREPTKASLRIGFICYLILKTFDYL